MYDSSYYGNWRLTVSFSLALTLHFILIGFVQISTVTRRQQEKIITDVELMRREIARPVQMLPEASGVPPADTAALEPKRFTSPPTRTTVSDAPLDVLKQNVRAASARTAEIQLIDKSVPVSRPATNILDDLVQTRSAKTEAITDIRSAAGQQTQRGNASGNVLFERTAPLRRNAPADGADLIAEVGAQRAQTISDIPSPNTQKSSAAPAFLDRKGLLEKKEAMKRQLAALGAQPLSDAQMSRSANQLADIAAVPASRSTAARGSAEIQDTVSLTGSTQRKTAAYSAAQLAALPGAGTAAMPSSGRLSEEQLPGRRPLTADDIMPGAKREVTAAPVAEVKQPPVTISGPLEKRKIVRSSVPPFPEWARKRGIEANVSLRFYVTPAGTVTTDVSVMQTSGFIELDQLCKEHIKKWLFEPLSPGADQQNQWGIITMRFILE